eukprot:309491_1
MTTQFLPFQIFFLWMSCVNAATIPTTVTDNTEFYNISTPIYVLNHIQCNTAICHITCFSGCHSLTVDASLSEELILNCSIEGSCKAPQITKAPQVSASVVCGATSCQNAEFHLTTTPTVDLACNEPSYSSDSACFELLLFAEYSQSVNINCEDYGCRSASFYVNGSYGTNKAQVNGLTINCTSQYACYDTSIHCPTSASCDVVCDGYYACKYMDIHVSDRIYDGLSILCDDTSGYVCSSTNIICETGSSSYLTLDGTWKCDDYDCCALKAGTITCPSGVNCVIDCGIMTCTNWIIDGGNAASLTVDCSTGSGSACAGAIIKCPISDMASCSVLCDDDEDDSCHGAAIQAVGSSMDILHVLCGYYSDCKSLSIFLGVDTLNMLNLTLLSFYNTQIFVDHSAIVQEFELHVNRSNSYFARSVYPDLFLSELHVASADVTCDKEKGCMGMDLALTVSESFHIRCIARDACSSIGVDVSVVGDASINITCQNLQSRYSYDDGDYIYGACDHGTFAVFSSIDWTQSASVACNSFDCYEATFNFTNVTQVDLDCHSENSCAYMDVDARNAQTLDLQCMSSWDSQPCLYADVHCPDKQEGTCTIDCDSECRGMDIMGASYYKTNNKSNQIVVIIVSAIGGIVCILIVVCVIVVSCRNQGKDRNATKNVVAPGQSTVVVPNNESVIKPTVQLVESDPSTAVTVQPGTAIPPQPVPQPQFVSNQDVTLQFESPIAMPATTVASAPPAYDLEPPPPAYDPSFDPSTANDGSDKTEGEGNVTHQ